MPIQVVPNEFYSLSVWTKFLLNLPTPLLTWASWHLHQFSLHHSAVTRSVLNLLCTNSHWLSTENQLHMEKERILFIYVQQTEGKVMQLNEQ